MKKAIFTVLVASGLVLSCGKDNSGTGSGGQNGGNRSTGGDNQGGGDDAERRPSGKWYGIVSKCLVRAEEKSIRLSDDSTAITVKQTITCSPKISGNSMDDVDVKLSEWRNQNCSDQIKIQNATAGNWAGCWIEPYGAQNILANNEPSVSEKQNDPEYCGDLKGRNYGTIKCN